MKIDAFLEEFEDVIIQRGRDYYENDRVIELRECAPGEFEATVEGSKMYSVSVSLPTIGQEIDFDCNCPYWNAPYCKHVVATLFAIEAYTPAGIVSAGASQPRRKTDPLAEKALRALPHETLVELLQAVISEYPEAGDSLRARLSRPEDEIKSYRQLIRTTIRNNEEHGYVSYHKMNAAMQGAEKALVHLEALAQNGEPFHTLAFSMMVMEETMMLIENGDDSNGGAGGVIEGCLACIDTIYQKRITGAARDTQSAYYKLLMEKADGPLFKGWDHWRERLLNQCVEIADSIPELRRDVMERQEREMKQPAADSAYQQYRLEAAQQKYYELLKRWEGADRAFAFLCEHQENDGFRVLLYQRYISQNALQKALRLCDSTEKLCKTHYGIVAQWEERRYAVYELQKDEEAQRRLATKFLLSGKTEYYEKLKRLYPPAQWAKKREEYLESLKKTSRGYQGDPYLTLLLADRDMPRLLEYTQHYPEMVLYLYQDLLPTYFDSVREMMRDVLRQHASKASDRRAYSVVCQELMTYQSVCGAEEAGKLIREMREIYRRKPAFQDELLALEKRRKE